MNFIASIIYLTILFGVHSLKHEKESNSETNDEVLNVGIVGAGITGLYSAILLNELGIKYEILEASNRTGGRFYTWYYDNYNGANYNYVEIGAMRFPKIREFDIMIGQQNWSLVSFLNSRLNRSEQLKLIPFITQHDNNVYYFNNQKEFASKARNCGKCFKFSKSEGGYVDDKYTKHTAFHWEHEAFLYIQEQVKKHGYKYLIQNDYKTFREFLMDPNGLNYTTELIDWIETMDAETGRFGFSLLDIYLATSYHLIGAKFISFDKGSAKLINAMESVLTYKPKLNHHVKAIKQLPSKELVLHTTKGKKQYTDLILTPTLSALRDIDYRFGLSMKKRTAMRTLTYAFTLKVGLQFKTRFWENSTKMNGKPIFGGVSISDLRNRQVVYPSYGVNCTKCRGVLLASYVWAKDAKYFLPFNDKEIADICLKDLATVHGDIVYREYTGKFVVMDWTKHPYTQGAYGSFDSGHPESYYSELVKPEAKGRVHFAGETMAINHGWTNGCLNSAFKTVENILKEHKLDNKLEQLYATWEGAKKSSDVSMSFDFSYTNNFANN